MSDIHQKTISDLRKMLVESGMSQKEADNIKGKANLVTAVLERVEEKSEKSQEVVDVKEKEVDNKRPAITSPEWQDFLMGEFRQEEMLDGYPTVYGLRRLVMSLLGQITFSAPVKLESLLTESSPGRAYCNYEVRVRLRHGEELVFGAAAGAFSGNTDDVYSVFPEAIAEVRAEARALRKALNLKTVSADELTKKDTKEVVKKLAEKKAEVVTTGQWQPSELISPIQQTFVEKKCRSLNINVEKFISSGDWKYNSIKDVTANDAEKMIDKLNDYQSNTSSSTVVPTDLLVSDK